jgi:hypothetical protein
MLVAGACTPVYIAYLLIPREHLTSNQLDPPLIELFIFDNGFQAPGG